MRVVGRSAGIDGPQTPRRQHHHQPVKRGGHPSQSYLVIRQVPSHLEAACAGVDVPVGTKMLTGSRRAAGGAPQLGRR